MIRTTLIFLFLAACLHPYSQPLKLMLPIGHTAPVSGLVLLENGEKIVSVSEDKTARIWSVYDQKQVARFESEEELTAVFEVPGADAFIACSDFGKASMWSTIRDSLLFRFIPDLREESFTLNFASADLSLSGEYFAMGFRDGTAAVWHLPTRTQLYHHPFSSGQERKFIRVQFTPDGRSLLVSPYGGESFMLIDPATGDTLVTFTGHSSPINSFAFDRTGKKLVTGGGRAEILVWDAGNGRIVSGLAGAHRQYYKYGKPASSIIIDSNYFVNQVSFDASGRRVISAADDGSAVIWDLDKGTPLFELPHGDGNVTQACFDALDERALTSSFNQTRLWDTRTGELLNTWQGKNARFERNGSVSLITRFLSGNSYGFSLTDPDTGRDLFPAQVISNGISEGVLMNNEQAIFTRMTDGQLHHWDMQTGSLAAPVASKRNARGLAVSHNGQRLAIHYLDSAAIIAEPAKNRTVTLQSFPGMADQTFFSTDDSLLVGYFLENALQLDSVVAVWNTHTGELVNRFDFPASVIQALLHPLTNELYVLLSDNTIRIYASVQDREPQLSGNTAFESYDLDFSGEGKYFLLRSDSLRVYLFDAPGRPVWQSLIYQSGRAEFSTAPGRLLLTDRIVNLSDSTILTLPPYTDTYYTDDSLHYVILTTEIAYLDTVQVFDLRKGVLLYNFRPHQNEISSIRFTRDGRHFYTFSEDNLIRKWETETGRMVFESFALDAENYFTRIPAGYYQATNSAAKMLHYVTKDLGVITFEQLDVKFNRPDKVLEAIGNTDSLLIRSYRQAWEKRIQRLGIDTSQFRESILVPESDILNRQSIAYLQEKETLQLRIRGAAQHSSLDRMNVWINEVPLFGQRGISLRNRNISEIDTVITVQLSESLNRIETSVTSRDGMESYRKPLLVNYVPARPPAEKLYFIGIGIDRFRDSRYNLQYSVQDIRELADAFGKKFAGRIEIDTLFNYSVTKENLASLKQKLAKATVHDKVIMAYSGHGLLSSVFDYYLSTWDVDFDRPEVKGIPYEALESMLDNIAPRRKLMLIDACHSGEVDRSDLARLQTGVDPRVKGLKPVVYKEAAKLGLQSSFELMQSLFVNVSKSTGATVISAAAGTQFALEQGSLENGVFTYAVLETIQSRRSIRISELKKSVSKRVEELTGGQQKPTSRSETISFDWYLF